MLKNRTGGILFTAAFVVLALYQQVADKKLDTVSIGLFIVAMLPWVLPMIAPYIRTVKVAGVQVDLQQLKKEVDDVKKQANANTNALVGGVIKAAQAALPAAREAKPARDLELPFPSSGAGDDANADPNFKIFGNKNEAGGYKLWAEVTPAPNSTELFQIHMSVTTITGSMADGVAVIFHLHPTFAREQVKVLSKNGAATLDIFAWGAFTIGAEVEGARLGLCLYDKDFPAPALFKSR